MITHQKIVEKVKEISPETVLRKMGYHSLKAGTFNIK
jgi:hypothetical protein